MGCWNETCALSGLPILAGEEVYFIVLTKNPYKEHEARTGVYIGDFWFPRTMPILARYNDYGNIEDWTPEEQPFIDGILEGFRKDLIQSEASDRDEILSIPARKIKNLTWEVLLEWLQEGHVRIDGDLESRASGVEMQKFMDKNYETLVENFGAKKERPKKNTTDKEKEAIKARNTMRDNRKLSQATKKNKKDDDEDEGVHRILPCCKIMIRKDVWDSLCEIRLDGWRGPLAISRYSEDATKFVESLRAQRREDTERFKELPADVRRVFRKARSMAHDVPEEGKQPNVFRYVFGGGVAGKSTPPFQTGPATAVEPLLEKCVEDDTDNSIYTALARLGELDFIETIMSFCRIAWHPTIGSGSQSDEKSAHFEFHARIAHLAREKDLEESREDWDGYVAILEEDGKLDECGQKAYDGLVKDRKNYAKWGQQLSYRMPESPWERRARLAHMEMIKQDPNVRFSAGE